MKATTLQSRIDKKITNKNGNINYSYIGIIRPLFEGKRIYKYWRKGERRHYELVITDWYNAMNLASMLGLDWTTGNDAPRGGKNGDYVELTAKGLRQVEPWLDWKINEEKKATELKAIEDAKIEAARRERQAKSNHLRELSNSSTYAVCVANNYDVYATVAYCHYKETNNYRFFCHELAAELHQLNNEGFRRFVDEQIKL